MQNRTRNRIIDNVFRFWAIGCTLLGIILLGIFLVDICVEGASRLNWDFITGYPSRSPEKSGILIAMSGTIWILILTSLISIPVGVAAGIYFEEYTTRSRWANLLEINITNLAGVPSIIYGILGLQVFVRASNLGTTIISGALTLSLLILPIIIVATRESLKAVPKSLREASFALGATKWQTIYKQVLPAAGGGIVTGVILALSRAIGETAPLVLVGALTYVSLTPVSPMDEYAVLPMQIFNWISRPEKAFAANAAAAIMALLIITFVMNGIAIYLRYRWQKKVKW